MVEVKVRLVGCPCPWHFKTPCTVRSIATTTTEFGGYRIMRSGRRSNAVCQGRKHYQEGYEMYGTRKMMNSRAVVFQHTHLETKASEMPLTIYTRRLGKWRVNPISVTSQSQQPMRSPEISFRMILCVLVTCIPTDITCFMSAIKCRLISYLR